MIYFVRHGQTDYNHQGRFQGQANIPLNKQGKSQAKLISEELKDYNIDLIYSSPLSRAKTTAKEINKYHNVPIKLDNRLMEKNIGVRQGLYYNQITEEDYLQYLDHPELYNAESNEDFYKRCIDFYNEIVNSTKNILIVSHGGVFHVLMSYITHSDIKESMKNGIDNCKVVVMKDDSNTINT